MKQPQLNENQQIVLDWLKDRFNETEIKASCTGYLWKLHQVISMMKLMKQV